MESSGAMLLIQVKNHCNEPKHCYCSSSACDNMLPTNAFARDSFHQKKLKKLDQRCVRVYMQLGVSRPSVHCEPTGCNGRRTPLEIFGINSRCISGDVKYYLNLMINGRIDLQTFFNYQLQQLAKSYYQDEPYPKSEGSIQSSWPFLVEKKTCGFRRRARPSV